MIGHTKAETWAKLEVLKHEVASGINTGNKYTVADAARDFLANGTRHLAKKSVEDLAYHVNARIIPGLGRVKLKRLRADDVDYWLNDLAQDMAASSIAAYIAISALAGIRTEEARPLEWRHLHLNPVEGQRCSCGSVHDHDLPPHVEMWHSVREGGDTKTPKSRRTSALPQLVIEMLGKHRVQQQQWRAAHGWKSTNIVYAFGTRYDPVEQAQVIRDQFRAVVAKAGIAGSWTPRELRHTYVSVLSDRGAPIELIADLVGHKDIATTRGVYRHQLKPVIAEGAQLIDDALGNWRPNQKGRRTGK
ncbi:tyrosine-type recombinase/integrase [Glycomyces dulcitolivorans]|uniref:tyrosine-type recombinase/integrase n=1 Tax=Glycomyces dulcitolivorans TaxID=2200759 RepID=UPI0018E4E4CF|nr:tyrosine-type recombinase/integrase [Glycomyces dulcitolivorans]